MELLKKYFDEVAETLPESIVKKYSFMPKKEALLKIHFPKSKQDISMARHRLAYEELYTINFKAISKKYESFKQSKGKSMLIKLNPELIKELLSELPFTLTDNQKIVLFQILKDMEKDHGMQRLLE